MISGQLEYTAQPAYTMKKNPIPQIKLGCNRLYGPEFNIDSIGVTVTDILAEEYLEALDYCNYLEKTQNSAFLNFLVAALYRPDRKKYDSRMAKIRANKIASLNENLKWGIYHFFKNIIHFLAFESNFSLLFSSTNAEEKSNNLGSVEAMYGLVKSGYGSRSEIANLNLDEYLAILMKRIYDAVSESGLWKRKILK